MNGVNDNLPQWFPIAIIWPCGWPLVALGGHEARLTVLSRSGLKGGVYTAAMRTVGYVLFALAIPFMVYATISYQRAIKTSGLPGRFVMGKPVWIEGKTFRLWSLLIINLMVGLSLLFGAINLSGKAAQPEWELIAYSILGPLLHWAGLSGLYRWSVRQKF